MESGWVKICWAVKAGSVLRRGEPRGVRRAPGHELPCLYHELAYPCMDIIHPSTQTQSTGHSCQLRLATEAVTNTPCPAPSMISKRSGVGVDGGEENDCFGRHLKIGVLFKHPFSKEKEQLAV